MKNSIRTKLVLLGIGSVLVSMLVMTIVSVVQANLSSKKSTTQVNDLIYSEMDQIASDTYNLIRSQDEAIQLQVNGGIKVLSGFIDKEGGLRVGTEMVDWDIKNQVTLEESKIKLPQLLLGDTPLPKVTSSYIDVPTVDELLDQLGAKATIFQPLPDGSGILRVATNVTTKDGTRAIGTYIPAKNADGTDNVVYNTVMNGQRYQGIAFVVDA